jgi:hypothetical protein
MAGHNPAGSDHLFSLSRLCGKGVVPDLACHDMRRLRLGLDDSSERR